MYAQGSDNVSIRIHNKLSLLPPTNSEHRIFRVHDKLRKVNVDAYEPTTISIGPYHYGKNNLQAMEEHKLRYLQQFLSRNNEPNVNRFVIVLRYLEERARKCYGEYINLDSDKFVEMMLLDGCFIIHFFRKCMFDNIRGIDPNDPIFLDAQTQMNIKLDLILLENQLPFFILVQLIDMTKSQHLKDNIVDLANNCFIGLFEQACTRVSTNNFNHILGFVYEIQCSSYAKVISQRKRENLEEDKWEFIKSTTELREAGVQFKKSSDRTISSFDIKFEDGVMEIPPLVIQDSTECIFRNLIAYEQYFPSNLPRYVTDYIKFMDCLINSAKDVEKLRDKGIIKNWLGDDEAVSTMFNKLCNQVMMGQSYCYSEVSNKVNAHCGKRRNIWLANLRRNYFYSPWSIISFIAATMFLVFTIIQTIYTVLSYKK